MHDNKIKPYEIKNDKVSLSIVPDPGNVITSIKSVPDNFEYLYKHYKPLIRPYEAAGGCNADDLLNQIFSGGYFDVIPNAGYKCKVNNITFGLHDESPYIPWYVDEYSDNYISTHAFLYKYPFKIIKAIEINKNKISINETVENLSNEELHFSWLHHPTFGSDILSANTHIAISESDLLVDNSIENTNSRFKGGYKGKWPYAMNGHDMLEDISFFPKKGKYNSNDLIYLTNLRKPGFSISNDEKNKKITFQYDYKLFKCLWMWMPTGGGTGYPWYGTIYALALEMSTSYPATGLKDHISNGTSAIIGRYSYIKTSIEIIIS